VDVVVRMAPSFFDAIPAGDRARLSALEERAEACEREAAVCRCEAGRIRRHYAQMVAVFGLEACVAHARRGTEIIEVP